MFYLYILYSVSSDKYYVGYTDCIERRLFEHNNSNRTTYTSKHRPWVLKKSIELTNNRGLALKIEKAIKKLKSRKIIESIITTVSTVEELAKLVNIIIY